MNLDEETIKSNEIIQAQQEKIMSQETQLAKVIAKEKVKKEKEKEKDKESEVNKRLKEQALDLQANRYGKVIKLSKFYKQILKSKVRDKIEICDKNDEVVLAKFGDFVIVEGGNLGIIDSNGNLMSYGKKFNQVIYKPDSFENQFRRGRFLIPMDKDGNWTEDIDYREVPEPLDAEFDEETGKLKRINWSKVKLSEVKKVIADKMEKINYLSNELDYKESVIIKLKDQLYDNTRALKIYENQSEIAETNLSKSLFKFTETEKRLGDLSSSILKLTELKAVYENLLDRKDEIINNVLKKLELTGDPKTDRLRTQIFEEIERYKAVLPERVEIKQEVPREPIPMTQPGEVIKR